LWPGQQCQTMNPFVPFLLPQYLFRPRQILTRIKREFAKPFPEFAIVELPWGERIRVRPHEVIGAQIWYYGIFDLPVAETICRLVDPGDVSLDIGANIGQMTSLLRIQAGKTGRVMAFEPHPEVFNELVLNSGFSDGNPASAPLKLSALALSDRSGTAQLTISNEWRHNRGLARIVPGRGADDRTALQIQTARLDDLLGDSVNVGLCKIDVEGHELNVFHGAKNLLGRRAVRDLLFEHLGGAPGDIHKFLLGHGYSLFSIRSRISGPYLAPGQDASEGGNYLATLQPTRAHQRFRRRGWMVLRRSRCPGHNVQSKD